MTLTSPASAQLALDSAAGPGATVVLSPGLYGDLRFNHNRPVLLQGTPGAYVKSIGWMGGQPRGNQQVKRVAFAGGGAGDTAIMLVDDVADVLIENCTCAPGYQSVFSIERADNRWPQPRRITIRGLHGRGTVGLGGIVGAADSVTLDNIALYDTHGGNGGYFHDKQATNLRLRHVMIIKNPDCGIRGGGVLNEECIAEDCLVGFSVGHASQSVHGYIGNNCYRYELQCGDYGPLFIEGARLSNALVPANLDAGGPGHHNLSIGGNGHLSRVEIRNSTAFTDAPESGTCFASSADPEYKGVVEMGMSQRKPGSPIEWGAPVSARYTFLDAAPPPGPSRTVAGYAASRGVTIAGLIDSQVPVQDVYSWLTEAYQ